MSLEHYEGSGLKEVKEGVLEQTYILSATVSMHVVLLPLLERLTSVAIQSTFILLRQNLLYAPLLFKRLKFAIIAAVWTRGTSLN